VNEINLQGVVHGPAGYIAVVVSNEHTYFLHESDPLANGLVERITKDSIILRERLSDEMGRPLTREVTRKLPGPAA
jgi:Tfp pilus assembly protein PilP